MSIDLGDGETLYPNGRCCVFQRFDGGGPFDKRFDAIIAPALKEAGLEPYRVDRDNSSIIPMDTLHREIQSAKICLADFTDRNPNVMYEMGYAFAAGKQVILITDQNGLKFPFDIQHRTIIEYSRDAPQDFIQLGQQIAAKAKALLSQEEATKVVAASQPSGPAAPTEGLLDHEAKALALVYSWSTSTADDVAESTIREQMAEAFFDILGTRLALSGLLAKELVVRDWRNHGNFQDDSYCIYQITELGEQWMMQNQHRFDIRSKTGRKPTKVSALRAAGIVDDEVPF